MTKDLKDWQKLALTGQKLKACIFYSRENSGGIGTARPAVEKYIRDTSILQKIKETMLKEIK